MSQSEFEYDVAVIGGGSGGYAAARSAAGHGLKVAILEGSTEVGGLCILRGCMPTKALLYAAEVIHLVRHAATWGINSGQVAFDFNAVMARKNRLIKEFADYRRQQLEDGPFDFIRARAQFVDAHTIALNTGKTLTARSFVIATGSIIAPSPLPQLDRVGYITSDDALALSELPESLIVLGGGAVGVEFAQFFARFGVKVSLVQRSARILKEFDEDATQVLQHVFQREGIELFTTTELKDAWTDGPTKGVTFDHGGKAMRLAAKEILFALGRRANTGGLDLKKIGVTTDGGRIITDATMQTTVPHIYAVGDCTSQHEIVHVAVQQGEVAGHNVAHPDRLRRVDYRLVPLVIFTDPQLTMVGLTEQEAKVMNIPHVTASYPFNDHGKSLIMEAKDGLVKLLADPKTGEIIGGACAGPLGSELIHEIIMAMYKHMTVQEVALMPHYHPTLAEIWTYPAEELAGKIACPS